MDRILDPFNIVSSHLKISYLGKIILIGACMPIGIVLWKLDSGRNESLAAYGWKSKGRQKTKQSTLRIFSRHTTA